MAGLQDAPGGIRAMLIITWIRGDLKSELLKHRQNVTSEGELPNLKTIVRMLPILPLAFLGLGILNLKSD